MANHIRHQLRDAVATAVTGLPTTGARVFQSRVYPLQITDVPCLVVTTDGDSIEQETVHHPYIQARQIQLRIEGYAVGVYDLDDILDGICKEVEVAVDNASLSMIDDIGFAGTQLDTSVVGQQPVGKLTLIYRVTVRTMSNSPDVAI